MVEAVSEPVLSASPFANLILCLLDFAVLHEWTLVMYGTGQNPYSDTLVRKFNIRQTHQKTSSMVTSSFDIPTTASPPTKLPVRPFSTLSREPSKHLSDNRIDHGIESSTASSAKNQTKAIFGTWTMLLRIALGAF